MSHAGPCACAMTGEKRFHVPSNRGCCVTAERGEAHTINVCKRCYWRSEQEVTASKWRESDGRAEGFLRKAGSSLWHEAMRAQSVGTFHHQKSLGQVGFGRCKM